MRVVLLLAVLTVFLSCGDSLTGPSPSPPLLQSGSRVIVLAADPSGPLSNLAALRFNDLVDAYESLADTDTMVIGLPIQGLPTGSPIFMERGFVTLDQDAGTASFAGIAPFHGFNILFALVGVWDEAGSAPDFALVIRVDSTNLGAVVPGVAGTVLEEIEFPGAAVILSERAWHLPDSVPAVMQQLVPGLATIEAGASFHGSFVPPAALARALELIPALPDTLPTLAGGFGLDASAVLADPGSAVAALEGLELDADLPAPDGPIGAMRIAAHSLTARWLDGGVVLNLHSDVRFEIDGAERRFDFTTGIDTRGSGAATLTGRLAAPWPAPFGLDWLTADSVELHVSGSAVSRQLRITAAATALDEFRATLTVDTDVPELRLGLSTELDAAALLRLVNGASGLTGAAAIRLPEGGPTLRQVDVTLRPEDQTPLVVRGNGTLLGNVEAGALLTLIRVDGRLHPLLSFHLDQGLIGALVPSLAGSALDDAVPGGTVVVPFPDTVRLNIHRDSLPPAAREYFDQAYEGLSDYSVEVSPVLRLAAPISLSAVPEAVATVLGLDRAGHALLGGSIGVTLGLLAGSASLDLDSLAINATIPFAGPTPGLPHWLQPRSHAISYRWERAADTREFSLDSHLRALLGTDSLNLTVEADLETHGPGSTHVSLRGRAGRWENPWRLHWLTADSLVLLIEGDPDSATVDLTADLIVAGVPTRLQVSATDQGDPELTLSIEPELTLASVAHVAGALGGVEAAVSVELPAGGPSLHGITATVRPGAHAPFALMGTGALRGGALEVFAMLTLVARPSGVTPVLVLRTGATTLAALAPSIGVGSPLDLHVPAMAITVPVPIPDGPITLPSVDLPKAVRDSLSAIFGSGQAFNLRLDAALRLDAPVPLSFVPAAVGRALALDLSGNAHIGGSIGVHLAGLTAGDVGVDSLTLFAVVPRQGAPSFPGWPRWLEPQRDSVALYWRRDPAASLLSMQSAMQAELGGEFLPFRIQTDLASDVGGDRLELRGRTGRWERPFGIDWFSVDSLGLRLVTDSDSTTVELGSAVEILGRGAALDIAVDAAGSAELQLTLDEINTSDVRTLLRNQWPNLALSGSFPDLSITDAFLYLRTGAVTGFSIGGNAHFFNQDATVLVSVARGSAGPLVVAGFGVQDFGLPSLLQEANIDLGENAAAFLDVFTFDNAAIMFSTTDVAVADSALDRHALAFYESAFGAGDFAVGLKSGITAVARRALPAGGPLEDVMNALAPENPDRSITMSGRIPGLLLGLPDPSSSSVLDGLAFDLSLPAMAPKGAPEWFRYGRLSLQLRGTPSIGLAGAMGVHVDNQDLDFEVAAALSAAGGGTLQLRTSAASGHDWVNPFGANGLTLRRLGMDLTLSAVQAGICLGGDMSIGTQDIEGAMGLFLNTATGVPTGGVFYAHTDRGLVLEDLVALQAAMFEGDPLGIESLPAMRLDTLELLVAVPSPARLHLACLGDRDGGGFAVAGNLWAQIAPSGPLDRLAHVRFELSRDGIIAQGDLASGSIGPITWTNPKLDLEVTRADQHLLVRGGASLGAALEIDSLELLITRDSLAFSTAMELFGGFRADIFAAASPSLTSPDFHVHGEVEGAFVQQLSVQLYQRLRQLSSEGHVILNGLRSNAAGVDIDAAVRIATITSDAAYTWWQDAVKTLRSLRSERDDCSWQICIKRYDAEILIWEGIHNVRKSRYEKASLALRLLRDAAGMAASVDAALIQLDRLLDNQRIVLSGAGFHTDLQQLLQRQGLEVHVNGFIDGAPLHVSVDLNAGFAHNVAIIVRDVLPAELGMLLHQ